MSDRLGTLVIGGMAYPVTSLRLVNGRLEICGELTGAAEAIEAQPVTVFGEDGRGVCQGGLVSIPPTRDGDVAAVTVYVLVDNVRDGGPG